MNKRRGGRDRNRRDERNEGGFEEVVVRVNRCSKTVKGGKRFSFSALVVYGDRKGKVGWGFGKANEVPFAVEKAIKDAKKQLQSVTLVRTTLPHSIIGRYGATKVVIKPACEGTGIKAGAAARAVLELAGVKDVLTKVYGSTNPVNVVKAVFDGLSRMRRKAEFEEVRGVKSA